MIKQMEHIHVPESGKYPEKIYDIQSTWNSQNWTWIKFLYEDYTEWCGEFRGSYNGHGISEKHKSVFVLTSDYLFQLNIDNGELVRYLDRPEYNSLTVSPNGDCFVASYYHISKIGETINDMIPVDTPKPLDMIVFSEWDDVDLTIYADEFINWDNHIKLKLNSESLECTIIEESKR